MDTIITRLPLVNIDPRNPHFTFPFMFASWNAIFAGDEHEFVVRTDRTLGITNDLNCAESSFEIAAGGRGMLSYI